MAMKDMMPWKRGKDMGIGALEGMKSMIDMMERAMEEPWTATGARLFGGEWMPHVEVAESEKEIVVSAVLPGLERDEIHVSAGETSLTIRGCKTVASKGKGEKESEQQYSFYRSFTLPSTVRPDEVKAHYKDGTLTVTLPKAKHSQVKRITIQ
jgi:HSP20 family protein